MKNGLSWCWDRVSGRKSKARSWITRVFANEKKRLPLKTGSLYFFVSSFLFFSLHRKRDVAITGGKRYKGLRLIEGC